MLPNDDDLDPDDDLGDDDCESGHPSISDAEIRAKLKTKGYQDDELDTMFPTSEKLREFYQESLSADRMHARINEAVDAAETEPPPEDDFTLSDAQKREYGV